MFVFYWQISTALQTRERKLLRFDKKPNSLISLAEIELDGIVQNHVDSWQTWIKESLKTINYEDNPCKQEVRTFVSLNSESTYAGLRINIVFYTQWLSYQAVTTLIEVSSIAHIIRYRNKAFSRLRILHSLHKVPTTELIYLLLFQVFT